MKKPIRILLADDHTIVRQGLARLLEEQPDLKIVGEAINGQAAVDKALELVPDIIIMDIAMPLLNGIEAAKRVRKSLPDCKILILSMYSHEHYIHQLLETGISGYLLKDSSGQDIIKAIKAAMKNETFLSPSISLKVKESYLSPQKKNTREDRYESLSNREREVFQHIAEGFSTKQITEMLCISTSTVKSHRANIMEKLGLTSPVQLGRFAIKLGLVDPDF
ncbi:MAG: response regulator transcription factor [Desulfobulbaceae bacterium]|jgi:DNA-binding NarL/FixJ family response regulator|nr:response regulator transcription factor [Desulfobulbaceae bacterium]MDH3782613.1 response regulator transcription factor [Desulfobulbaceae bacterium]